MPLGAKILLDPNIEEQYGMIDIIPDRDVYGEYKINTKSSPLLLRDKPDTNADIIVENAQRRTIFCYGFTDITMDGIFVNTQTAERFTQVSVIKNI